MQRRNIVMWIGSRSQAELNEVMQTAMQVSSSLTGSTKTSAAVLNMQNRWSRIQGERSVGWWVVGSSRTVEMVHKDATSEQADQSAVTLERRNSFSMPAGEIADNGTLGVEIDVQMGQMTLRSKHLTTLPPDVSNHGDVKLIFGDTTIQASLVEEAQHRKVYKLVGLNHEIEFWHTPHKLCPPVDRQWSREYDPADFFDSEKWIVDVSMLYTF